MEQGEESAESKPSLCFLPSRVSVCPLAGSERVPAGISDRTQPRGVRGSDSELPACAAAGLQDGAGSQAAAAAPRLLPPRGC